MDSRQLQLVLKLQDNATAELRKLAGELGKVDSQTKTASSGFSGVTKSIAGMAAAYISVAGVISTAKIGLTVAADMQTAEVGLKTLLGSSDAAAATIARLKVEASRTPFELPGLTQATQLLTSITKDGDKSIDIILNVGEALAAMGKGQGELDRIIVNLQQIASVGHAATIDIKQFAFAGIPIYEMLAEATGKNGEALSKFIEDGGVTFDMLTKMFDKANDDGGRFFNAFVNQSGTFNQAASNMKDSFGIMMSDILKSSGVFQAVTDGMIMAANAMSHWRDVIENVGKFISEHQLALSMLAGAITAVLLPVLVTATIAFGTMAFAAISAFAAMALAAAPFLIVGAVIGGLAYLIITNWEKIKTFFVDLWETVTETTSSAMQALGETIAAAWETIKSVFWTGINFYIGLWATLLDFIVPGWDGMLATLIQNITIGFQVISEFISEATATISGILGGWYTSVKDTTIAVWTTIKDFFKQLWTDITGIFSGAKDGITKMMDDLAKPIQRIIDLAQKAMSLAGSAVKSSGNYISSSISSILERGASITGNRAVGGTVAAGNMYQVGEHGPEMFVAPSNGSIMPAFATAGMGGGAGVTVNVYGDITGEDLINKVKKALMGEINQRIR